MTTTRRAAAGLGAFAVLASLLVGVPLALILTVGWPLPHSLPTVDEVRTLLATSGIPDVVLIDTLAVICWIAWLDFALATVVELGATIAGRAASRPLIARPWQALVARLVTTVVVAVVVIGSRPQSSPPPRSAALSGALAGRVPNRPSDAVTVGRSVPAPAPVSAPTSDRYVVRGGDTLWGIASQRLRDPRRWPTIWRDNAHRSEPGGRRFNDPDLIVPGWTLDVPTHATTASTAPPPPQSPVDRPTSRSGATPAPLPSGGVTPAPSPARSSAAKPVAPVPSAHGPAARPAHSEVGPSGVTLPSGGLVGAAFASGVVAGLATARLHERRRRRVGSVQTSALDRLVGPTVRHLRHAIAPRQAPEEDDQRAYGPAPPEASEEATPTSIAGPLAAGVTGDGDALTIIDVVDLSGRSLTGDGADGVGRALVTAAVVEPPLDGTNLVVVGEAQRLLGRVGSIPDVEVIDSLARALTRLDAECERRERVLRWQGGSDYRSIASSSDPLGALLVVVDGGDVGAVASSLRAITDRGRLLGISIVVIGEAPGFEPVEVADDGVIGSDMGAAVSERLFTVADAEASELLALASAGRGGDVETVPAPAEADGVPDNHAPTVAVTSLVSDHAVPVELQLFGPPRLVANGAEVTTGLRAAARELMCLLAVHRLGLRQEEAIAEMWPDDEDEHLDTFRVAITSTRRRLRELCGQEGQYVALIGNRYILDAGTIDCDLWRFDAAMALAARESDPAARRQALRAAAELVAGEPLAGASYEWAEPVRETLRRRAIDVLGELGAVLGAEGDLAGAVQALDRARTVDPYCEDVYRRLMGYLADMGRDDVALRVYRELEKHVAQLGAQPDEQTDAIVVALRSRAAAARPASSPRVVASNPGLDDDDEAADDDTPYAARTTIVGRRAHLGDDHVRQPRPVDQDQLPIVDVVPEGD
jgi:DNA-binding SARP family transcriptional activator/LysM repeat protein